MALRILGAGAGCTVQDAGRAGYGRYGVPRGGGFDMDGLRLANRILGNAPEAPALEVSYAGITLRNDGPKLTIAIAGAPCKPLVNGEERGCQARWDLDENATLQITHFRSARVYLALPDGVRIEPVLGSCSGIGLGPATSYFGNVSAIEPGSIQDMSPLELDFAPGSLRARALRFVPGQQSSDFDLDAFEGTAFTVLTQSDRRGLRLGGTVQGDAREIGSQPVCAGCIQVTPSGMPIVLGPDGPTVGGYPVIGCVVNTDIDRLGQLLPGDEVRFVRASGFEPLAVA